MSKPSQSACRAPHLYWLAAGVGLVFLLSAGSEAAHAGVCRVNTSGTAGADGSNWTDQAMDLQAALAQSCDEIWVKSGVYTLGPSRSDSFAIAAGTALYGGFGGSETSRNERDPANNPTVLSGDIDGDDANVDGNHVNETAADIVGGNSIHVVVLDGTTGTPITSSTILDGFIITGGDADGGGATAHGGGLYCNGMYSNSACSPAIRNTVFSGNRAQAGGAMFNAALFDGTASPSLENVRFFGNSASGSGGALFNMGQGGTSSPELVNVAFAFNHADDSGGALFNQGIEGLSSPSLRNVLFHANTAGVNAGAMYNQAQSSGPSGPHGHSSPQLANVTFSSNSSGYSGGAMVNNGSYGGISNPSLTNVTFAGNATGGGGGTAMASNGLEGTYNPVLNGVILWGDTSTYGVGFEMYNNQAQPSIAYSIVQGSGGSGPEWESGFGLDGGGNLDADPMLYPLADNGGTSLTHAIPETSPAWNAGDPAFTSPPGPTVDQRGTGYARVVGGRIDIGAFESQGPLDGDTIFSDGFESAGP